MTGDASAPAVTPRSDAYDRVTRAFTAEQAGKCARIRTALATLVPGDGPPAPPRDDAKLDCGLLHHALYVAMRAADRDDSDLARAAVALGSARTEAVEVRSTPAGTLAVVDSTACLRTVDGGFEMPVFAIVPGTLGRPSARAGLVAAATGHVHARGFGRWLEGALAIVVLLNERAVTEQTSSWSITALPYTLYSDYYLDPDLFAKDLLHEAAHSWLREALATAGEDLPPEHVYHSPWKRRLRPAMAMLHSSLSFSLVARYLARTLEDAVSEETRTYALARVAAEKERLGAARESILAACGQLADGDVREVVERELQLALEC